MTTSRDLQATAAGCTYWLGQWYCATTPTRFYVVGHRCPRDTPAALTGHQDNVSDPRRTLQGLHGLRSPTPATATVVDDRAIASGKRRASAHAYAAAVDAELARATARPPGGSQ